MSAGALVMLGTSDKTLNSSHVGSSITLLPVSPAITNLPTDGMTALSKWLSARYLSSRLMTILQVPANESASNGEFPGAANL